MAPIWMSILRIIGQVARIISIWFKNSKEITHPIPDNKVHGANKGPTWVLSAPDGPHVGPMNLAIRDVYFYPSWMARWAARQNTDVINVLFPRRALFCSPCPSDIIQGPYVDYINLYHNIGHKDRDTIIVFYCMSIIIIEEMSYWLVLHVHMWVVVWGYPRHQQHRWLYCGCVREWCWEIYCTSWLDMDKLGSTLCIYSGLLLGYIMWIMLLLDR